MKFFNNLPKTTFESTLGSFTISDFFTYLDVDKAQIEEASINIDDKTTLVEAAYKVYSDSNSFWAFVAANNVINPFDLTAPNSSLYTKTVGNKVNFVLFNTPTAVTGGVAFPVGSIVVPYAGNSGACYQYGVTGNFDLTGPLAVIEESSFYDGNMVIGQQTGGTGDFIVVGNPSEQVTVIKHNDDDSYTWMGSYYTKNKKYATDKVVSLVQNKDGKTIYREIIASNPTIDDLLPFSTPIDGITTPVQYTSLQVVDKRTKDIQAYVPNQLGLIQASFVTTKYN
jgi:hypothetical protein